MLLLSLCCQSLFPRWESQSTSPAQDALQHCAGLWTCRGRSSDSNLLLRLCVPASNVHSHQNWCLSFCGSSQWPFIDSIDTVGRVDPADLICILRSWWEGFGSSSSATLPWVSIVVLSPPLHVGRPLGFAPEAALEALGLPREGRVRRWGSCLVTGFWPPQVLRGLAAGAAGNRAL